MSNNQSTTQAPTRAVLHFTLATAGHVDHGKTSLLRALTGIDPDRLKEEKEREMTTDIGFAHLRLDMESLKNLSEKFVDLYTSTVSGDDTSRLGSNQVVQDDSELVIGFVDVPGHGKFLKNMLAGVGGIDMALLVVAADESVMPQTVQHVKILSLLGVKKCVVVLTKVDLCEEDDIAYATEETKELLGEFGIEALAFQNVSNTTSSGIDELKATIIEKVLTQSFSDNRYDLTGKPMPCYLPVDRIFSKPGYGVVVTGTLISGELTVGDQIQIAPAMVSGRVRGLQTFKHNLEKAFPGQRLAVNIASKDSKALERGQCVVSGQVRKVRSLIVTIDDLGGLEARLDRKNKKLKPQSIRFYHGTAERTGALRWINELDGTYIGQIYLKEPVLAYPDQNYVIRYGDYGIAGGTILLTSRPRWLTREKVVDVAERRIRGDLSAAILSLLKYCPGSALTTDELAILVSPKELDFELARLKEGENIHRFGSLVISKESFDSTQEEVVEYIKKQDANGVSLETLRVEVAPLMERIVFQHIVNVLTEAKVVEKDGEKLRIARKEGPDDRLSEALASKKDRVLEVLGNCLILEVSEVAKEAGLSPDEIESVFNYLEKNNQAYLVNYDFAGVKESINKAHRALADIWNQKRAISPSDFRQALGTSRKYAMALLAHFDDQKVTRRLPSGRVLLKGPD